MIATDSYARLVVHTSDGGELTYRWARSLLIPRAGEHISVDVEHRETQTLTAIVTLVEHQLTVAGDIITVIHAADQSGR